MVSKKKKLRRLEKIRKKTVLQAAIARRKLLQAITQKKAVSVLRRVEDKIPNVLVKKRDEEIKQMFINKGRYKLNRMGDKYYTKHQRKNPKLTPEQIRRRRIKRNKDKKKERGY